MAAARFIRTRLALALFLAGCAAGGPAYVHMMTDLTHTLNTCAVRAGGAA